MTVYIEYVFLSNFIYDFLLLYATAKITKIRIKKVRLFFADCFASATAIAVPLFNFGMILSVAVKLALSTGIISILAKYNSKKQFFAALLLFWGLTFAFGGILFGLYFLTSEDFALQNDLSVVSSSYVPVFIGGLLCFVFFVKNVAAYINAKRANNAFTFDVKIVLDGESVQAQGFLDSGNRLIDAKSGLPVIIAVSEPLKQKLKKIMAEAMVKGVLKDVHFVEFCTISGHTQKMPVFAADGVFVGDRQVSVLVGMAGADVRIHGDCDLLLNGVLKL